MPQLDKLTFTSQVFWFFILFIFLYYSMVQMTVVKIKLILGLKRFFFQADKNNSFYELSKNLKLASRYDLLFFFDFNNLSNENSSFSNSNLAFNVLKNSSNTSFLSSYIENFFKLFENLFNQIGSLLSNKNKKSNFLEYNYVLDLNKSAYIYSYLFMSKSNVIDLKEFSGLTKSINYFYEQFLNIFNFFFKAVQFYIYDTIFVLFYYFFNIFFKFRDILYFFKLLNKISI
jgi:hypothetical protein